MYFSHVRRERGVALPCFGNVPLHHVPRAACRRCLIPRTGVTAFYNTIPRTAIFCAPIVILSRRACGVSKNLTRLQKSCCNAMVPAFLYSRPIVPLPDPSTSSLAFARLSAQDDRKGGVSPLPCFGHVPLHQVPRIGVTALSCPLRGQR